MGDPRKIRKKYNTPSHPWEKRRIEEEAELKKTYAPKNKKEIWKMNSLLTGYKDQAKTLSSLNTAQAEKEKMMLVKKLISLSLLKPDDRLESILKLTLQHVMERRLQTIVFKKGLAKSTKQARQFITHAHVKVGGKVITSPSYLVLQKEERAECLRHLLLIPAEFYTRRKMGVFNRGPDRPVRHKNQASLRPEKTSQQSPDRQLIGRLHLL